MKKSLRLFTLTSLLFSAFAGQSVVAQTDKSDKSKSKQQRQRTEFVDQYNRRHAGQKPLVGDVISHVDVFSENGNKFSTQKLDGNYSVLVFGCLT